MEGRFPIIRPKATWLERLGTRYRSLTPHVQGALVTAAVAIFVWLASAVFQHFWYARENSFLRGQLANKKDEIQRLQRQLDRAERDSNNEITQLKLDLSAAKRDGEAEATRLRNKITIYNLSVTQALPQ